MAYEGLRKAELLFEVISRGEKPANDVTGLRTQFKNVVALAQGWKEGLSAEAELSACRERMEELTSELGSLDPPPTGYTKRVLINQLQHWQGRLRVLSQAPGLEAPVMEWIGTSVQLLQEALDPLRAPGQVATALTQLSSNRDTGLSAPLASASTDSVTMGGAVGGISLPLATGALLSSPLTVPTTMPQFGGGASGMGLSFTKLPHPLTALMRDFCPVDGLHVERLLDFFVQALRLHEFPGVSDRALMELITPFCQRPLGDLLFNCLARGTSFDVFHQEALNCFVPLRVLERLRLSRIYRPQRNDESLSEFLRDVSMVGRVLRLQWSERDFVDTVLQGLNPEERSRLTFAPRPANLAELERLAIFSLSVGDADRQRALEESRIVTTSIPVVTAPAMTTVVRPTAPRGPVTCYGCGQVGHYRSACPNPRAGPKN